jgi:hypothetical protein
MNKSSRACIIVVLVLMALLVAGLIFMITAEVCPPTGPWPLPPWCYDQDLVSTLAYSTPEAHEIELTPTTKPLITTHVTVTIPYWTAGDVYVGTEDDPALVKLDKINEVTYEGNLIIKQDQTYVYSLGSADTVSSNTFQAASPESLDAVFKWGEEGQVIPNKRFQKGITLGGSHWREEEYMNLDWALDKAKEYGVTHVLVVPVAWVYPDNRGNDLKFVYFGDPLYDIDPRFNSPEWGYWGLSLTDDQIREIAQKTRAREMEIVLKPHLDVWDGTSRGAIEPSDPDLFYENYTTFITHYADLAREIRADLFVVGTELDSVANANNKLAANGVNVTGHWQDIITAVRYSYTGKITYSVSCFGDCGGTTQVRFWDQLDYIGFEPYFGVTAQNDPTIPEMKNGLLVRLNQWAKALSDQYGKDVILTEVNVYAFDGMNKDPNAIYSNPDDFPVDKQEQADYYEALFQAIQETPYIKGSYPWSFWLYLGEKSDYERIQAEKDKVGDNLSGVLAGQVVKKWYNMIQE